uniref:Uncharacterized protein n=1 Tax=Tanacetum cinerariifolium TaxID=118510 RepID=A0A6L2KXH1_TANCI|nr:hypothetical protein [Tanacetum cinerariifolium]
MHEVMHEMVVGECHEPNSKGSGSAWMAYMNARAAGLNLLVLLEYHNGKGVVRATSRGLDMALHWSGKAYINAKVTGLFLLVLLEYPNGKGVVRTTSKGLDMALHWSGVGVAPLMSPRQDETSEPLLYAGWMVGPYRCKDVTRGQNNNSMTSVIRARSDRGCRLSMRMTMHEVVHEIVVGECHEPNSKGSGVTWKAYMNVRVSGLFLLVLVAGLFLLVLLEYPNGKYVVRATSRGLDMALHLSRVRVAPLMSPRQDETSEPLLYAGWMTCHYWCKDATRGRNNNYVTSGIKARRSNGLIQMVDDSRCTLDLKLPERKAYMNAKLAGLFLLVLLEYPNDKGVVHGMSKGLDMALHWSRVRVAPLMSPRQDETSEPLLYVGWMVDPYRCKDATRG